MNIDKFSGYLRISQIIKTKDNPHPLIPISKSSWWAGVKSGRFPKPIKLGPRTTVWTAESINQLIQQIKDEQ